MSLSPPGLDLTVQQAADIFHQFVRTGGAISVVLNQSAGYLVHPFNLSLIRVDGGGGDFDDILKIREQLLLDGILQRLM
ncbi:hypothetical protein D3C73_1504950 [compost metagenome]